MCFLFFCIKVSAKYFAQRINSHTTHSFWPNFKSHWIFGTFCLEIYSIFWEQSINAIVNLLKTYIELNNPVLIFKCDQAYIQERLIIYGGLEKVEKKKTAAKREPTEREQFVKLMHTELVEDLSTTKKPEKQEESEEAMDDEIIDYTNTLTIWVKLFYISAYVFFLFDHMI